MFPDRYKVCRFSRIFAPNSGRVIIMSQNTNEVLVRLCSRPDWAAARGRGSLHPEPPEAFVHLSTVGQVHLPANRLYHGRRDLVLLYIDAAALDSPVLWEPGVPTDPESMRFPHLYGPLPVEAVLKVEDYLPGADGSFASPVAGEGST